MLDRLKFDPDAPDRYRVELDQRLDVDAWRVPGQRPRRDDAWRPANAPSWWRGDEEASQGFLHAMGVVT